MRTIPSRRVFGRPVLRLVLLLAICWITAVAAAADHSIIDDAQGLWRGIDPTALPLNVEILDRWTEPVGQFEKLRFTSEVCDGVPARVFAIQGAPPANAGSGKLPGILHIHGGGQTASLEWVRFWVQRGYTCVTFDFCGPWAQRTEVTEWGPLKHANMAHAAGGFQVRPTPRASSWFHWALASRRALTLLERHPRTDPDRLGIFGISMGGTLCWLVSASDERVKTSVPIYGCGYNHDNRRERFGFGRLSDDLDLYKRTLAPEAHAKLIRAPVFFLNATNDFHGPLDFAFESLTAVDAPTRWAFTPRFNHHIAPCEARDLPLWMDWQLRGGPAWPESPRTKVTLDDAGVPRATITADRADEVTGVEILYSLGDRLPAARYWRTTNAERVDGAWQASVPVMSLDEPLLVLASVTYRSGVILSSNMPTVVPRELGSARASLAWTPQLGDGPDGFANWYFTTGATDPSRELQYIEVLPDTEGAYLTLDRKMFPSGGPVRFSTHILGDPQNIGRPGDVLTFDFLGDFGEKGLTVRAIEHDGSPRSKTYAHTIPSASPAAIQGAGSQLPWRSVQLSPEQLRTAEGLELTSWQNVQRLELEGQTAKGAGFRRFRWQPGG